MFEHRRTVQTLYLLARERARSRSIRIRFHLKPKLQRLAPAGIRLFLSIGFGAACGYLPLDKAFALVGWVGLLTLILRWGKVVADASPPPRSFLLFPASAELIWKTRSALFRLGALWYVSDALAVIYSLAANHHISGVSALASIPSAFAFGAWMTALPLLLALGIPFIKPGAIASPAFILGIISLNFIKDAPLVSAAFARFWTPVAWYFPTGWFFHFAMAAFQPAPSLLLGGAALVVGLLLIRSPRFAWERRIVRNEEDADRSDAIVANTREVLGEVRKEARSTSQSLSAPLRKAYSVAEMMEAISGPATPLGEAHSLVDGDHWGSLPRTTNPRGATLLAHSQSAPEIDLMNPPQSSHFGPILIIFAAALICRWMGRGMLALYLLLIERSWLDAIVKLPKQDDETRSPRSAQTG